MKESETSASTAKQFPSAFNLFQPSIRVLGLNFVPIALAIVIPFAISFLSGMADSDTSGFSTLGLLLSLASLVASVVLMPVIVIAQLQGARRKAITFGDAYKQGLPWVLRLLGLSILQALIIFIGFLLLIVPGLFMLRRYMLAPYYLIDQKVGVFEALKRSAADSKVYSRPIWGLIGVEILILLPWIIPFLGWIVGFVLAVLYLCAPAIRYVQIQNAKKGGNPNAPIEAETAA